MPKKAATQLAILQMNIESGMEEASKMKKKYICLVGFMFSIGHYQAGAQDDSK